MIEQEYRVRREIEAAKSFLAGMRELIPEDDLSLLADMLEGETNLFEAIDTALGGNRRDRSVDLRASRRRKGSSPPGEGRWKSGSGSFAA